MHERGTIAPRPRHVRGFLAQLVGTVGGWFHFARRIGVLHVSRYDTALQVSADFGVYYLNLTP